MIFFVSLGMSINLIYAQNLSDSTKVDSSTFEILSNPVDFNSWDKGFKVNFNDFNKGAIFSPLQLIQGKVPGFTINCLNVNDPNPDIQTQLRGASSAYLPNKPLYIVNGIALDNIDFIPVENIESIEVLKNISETALYGIRGVDGVIIISTKKSLPQKFNISYNTYGYIEKLGKSDYMTANEWRQLKATWANSIYSEVNNYGNHATDYNANTDWLKEISQYKLSQSHFLDFSGTFNKTSYMANVAYNSYNGIVQKTGNNMLSGQLYISQLALKDKLQMSLFLTGTERDYSAINKNVFINNNLSTLASNYTNIIHFANQYNPTVPINKTDTSYSYSYNPLQLLNLPTDKRTQNNELANLALSFKLTKDLKISTSYSTHKKTEKNTYSEYNDYRSILLKYGEYNELKEKIFTINLNYNKSINNHHINLLLNYSNQLNYIETKTGDLDARLDTIVIFNPNPGYEVIGNGTYYASNKYRIINTTASIKYDYKNKYFLSAGISQEKSPLYKYQISTEGLLSLKAGWALKRERFLQNISWLNEFKLFAGYGVSKRQGSFYDNGINIIPNPDLHGEKLYEGNFGVDVSLLSSRLGFSVNYYNRLTNDGIELISVRPSANYTAVLINDVEIKNNGWEFNIKSQPVINPVNWTFDFSISLNKNIILSGYNIKNQAFGSFYGYKFAGFSTNGDVLVYDKNGNAIPYYNASYSTDSKLIGNGMPKSFFGLTNNFQYKNFDLSISIRGALGFNIENKEYYSYVENSNSILLDRNFKNYIQTVDQRALLWQNAFSLENTDYIIEKGDYVKIDNITLSYTIPSLNKVIKNLKLYIGCNNVALFTKFRGGDPEMAGIFGANHGIYYKENYPFTRIFVLGLKCNL
jgi:TonB-linked SusC/RagA family outer membrane protein